MNNSHLKFEVEDDGTKSIVLLRGDIMEGVGETLSALPAFLKHNQIVFNCEYIGYINTMGIGGFARFMKSLGISKKLEFIRCPQGFVEHAMMIPSLVGGGRVTSLYVNFECPSCGRCRLKLVERTQIKTHDLFPNESCPGCSKPMHIMIDADELDARILG